MAATEYPEPQGDHEDATSAPDDPGILISKKEEECEMIERQVIVTWYTPEEKLPKEFETVVATISGKTESVEYDHALCLIEWCGDQWDVSMMDVDLTEFVVHAWCDLEPYGDKS